MQRRSSELPLTDVCCCRTTDAAVAQARQALRRFREAQKEGQVSKQKDEHPVCCRIDLPVPHPGEEEKVKIFETSEFPGGVQQQFRALRPLIEDLLFGCAAALET